MFAGLFVTLLTGKSYGQTKVFKAVNNSISTSIRTIVQDGNLVGYLAFTELERANADSFRYKLNIMDENLNDIGVLNFTELKLDLQSVAFEGDVLCLAYLKSNFIGYGNKSRRERKEQLSNASVNVFTQFVNLDGKIINANTVKADIKIMEAYNLGWDRTSIPDGILKHPIRLRNMAGKGFVCSYSDNSKSHLIVYDATGKNVWQNDFLLQAQSYAVLASGHDIYLLCKKVSALDGGYWLMGYNVDNGAAFTKYELSDKKGHQFNVLAFDNDPVTGRPYVAGYILHPKKGSNALSVKQLAKGPYLGVYTLQVKGAGTSDIESITSDWSAHTQPAFSKKGRYQPNKTFVRFEPVFKDFSGNTYFSGTSYKRKPKWGSIAATTILLPTIIPPIWVLSGGTQKAQARGALLFKQDNKGQLSYVNTIPTTASRYQRSMTPFFALTSNVDYFALSNSDTKANYLVLTDKKQVNIYDVNKQKVIRTIPRKEGTITTNIYPAKEGHVLVSEYNSTDKSRTLNIEAL